MPLTPVYVEKATGDSSAPELEKQHGGVTKETRLSEYLDFVGKRLAANAKRKDVSFKFQVLDSEDIVNAFALGNGNVYVTRGLLHLLNDEAELAEVVGHEIGHIDKRHIASQIDKAVGVTGLLALAEGIYAARKGDKIPEGSQALIEAANQLVPSLVLNGFSRENEHEADEVGLKLAVAAGYDPQGAVRVFRRFQQMEPDVEGLAIFFRSHPLAKDRIADLEQRIMQKYPSRRGETFYDRYQSIVNEGASLKELESGATAKPAPSMSPTLAIAGGIVLIAGVVYVVSEVL